MYISTLCPCCSTPLLHHFGDRREYWFCRHCWQEMPTLESKLMPKSCKINNIIALTTKLSISKSVTLAT